MLENTITARPALEHFSVNCRRHDTGLPGSIIAREATATRLGCHDATTMQHYSEALHITVSYALDGSAGLIRRPVISPFDCNDPGYAYCILCQVALSVGHDDAERKIYSA
jgi:hypothetical protein